jgi:hypothetical protein
MSALNGFMGYHSIALDFQLLSPYMNGSVPFCNAWARAINSRGQRQTWALEEGRRRLSTIP